MQIVSQMVRKWFDPSKSSLRAVHFPQDFHFWTATKAAELRVVIVAQKKPSGRVSKLSEIDIPDSRQDVLRHGRWHCQHRWYDLELEIQNLFEFTFLQIANHERWLYAQPCSHEFEENVRSVIVITRGPSGTPV